MPIASKSNAAAGTSGHHLLQFFDGRHLDVPHPAHVAGDLLPQLAHTGRIEGEIRRQPVADLLNPAVQILPRGQGATPLGQEKIVPLLHEPANFSQRGEAIRQQGPGQRIPRLPTAAKIGRHLVQPWPIQD